MNDIIRFEPADEKANQLIPITMSDEGIPTVNGRALHEFLGVGTEYRHWFPRMCEYGFIDGLDYTPFIFDHPKNKQETVDHAMSLDMAKELSMIQRTEKGKQARQYFIAVEKEYNSPEKIMARALIMANHQIDNLKLDKNLLEAKIQNDKPLVLLAKSIEASDSTISMSQMAKVLKQRGYDNGRDRLYNWCRDRGFVFKDSCEPTQTSVDMGILESYIYEYYNSKNELKQNVSSRVTGKGQIYFVNKLVPQAV